ncbi:hypothetical protein F5X99DRAFT_428597 [Biscogniauxia marginata]|nr:hypothetical protein F5X99DRAFT_428597 [Biscogniauxia marginata]
MCELTRLSCEVCKSRSTFLFRFCETISKDKHFGSIPPTGYRIYCPDFIWPPEELENSHYKAKIEQDALKAYAAKDPSRSGDVIELEDDSDDDNEDETQLCKVTDAFHEAWFDVHPLIKGLVVEKYRVTKRKEFNSYWESRVNDVPLRTLKLLIPFCKICNSATLSTEGGLDGVEMQPDLVLWKWMFKLQRETMIETNLSTDTMMKPCSWCANQELKLRRIVGGFLESCTNQQAWALWRWLLMRGRGGVDFWNLKDMDTAGFPDSQPHEKHTYLRLMAEGWEDKAGSAWENFVEIDSLPSYGFPVIHCPDTLVEFRQLKRFADFGIISTTDAELAFQPSTPPLWSEEPSNDENPDSVGDSIQEVQGEVTVAGIGPEGVKYKPIVSRESSQTVTESDVTEAHAQDRLDTLTGEVTYDARIQMANKDTGTTMSWDDIMQEDDDLFGDNVAGGYDDLAVQPPDGTTHTDGHDCAAPSGDVEMGDAASNKCDPNFEQYKGGYWPYPGPTQPGKKRVHFE